LAALKAHAPQYHYTLDIEPPPGLVLNPAAYSAIRSALEYGNSYATPARPRAGTLRPGPRIVVSCSMIFVCSTVSGVTLRNSPALADELYD